MLNTRETFASSRPWELPEVAAYEGPLPERFVAWSNRKRMERGDGLHFFVDDDRFEPVWTSVDRYRRHFVARVACGPDFSSYTDWPLAACLWNTYRARWLARAMSERGALIIPAVTWGRPETFAFAFEGLARGGSVAVSAYGAKRFEREYRAGYEAMFAALSPRSVVVVGGKVQPWMGDVLYFPSNTIADRR